MKYLLVLGNGFSMDLLNHIGKLNDYPLNNLFSFGDKLCWPENGSNAFISFRNTPNLWLLGVRSNNPVGRNSQIVENIITCANAIYTKNPKDRFVDFNIKGDIYINAYKELVCFLKYLFVHFDQGVEITEEALFDWPWARMLKKLARDEEVEEVCIITFNYDLWMERVLDVLNIEYRTAVIENGGAGKFVIVKPHGSISFVHNKSSDISNFNINYNYEVEILEGEAHDFTWRMTDLFCHSPITPLIPPAGDSGRFNVTWAGKLREKAKQTSDSLEAGDRVVICGLSYWYVDRREIDEILLHLNNKCEIAYINPNPPEALDAVLTSLFCNYEHYLDVGRYAGGQNA